MAKQSKGRNQNNNEFIKLLNDMKKTYVSPLTDEVNVMTEAVMDGSIPVNGDSDKEVDTTQPGGQLGNTHRGEWGNLWSK